MFLQLMGGKDNPGKQAHDYGRNPGNGTVRPLALSFRPAWAPISWYVTPGCQREPLHNLHRTCCPVGAEDNLGSSEQ